MNFAEQRAKRDETIVARLRAGESSMALARVYSLSHQRISQIALRAGLSLADRVGPVRHGTVSRYRRGCRCNPCTLANTERQRRRRARLRAKPIDT